MITGTFKAIVDNRREEVKELARLKKQILDCPVDIPNDLAVEYLTRYFVFTAFNHFIYNCHCNFILRFNFIELCSAYAEGEEISIGDINFIFNINRIKNCQNYVNNDIHTIEDLIETISNSSERIKQRKECKDCLDDSPFYPYTKKNRYFEAEDLTSDGHKYKLWFEDINKEFNKFVLNKETIDTFFKNINELGILSNTLEYREDREYFCLSSTVEIPMDLTYILDL